MIVDTLRHLDVRLIFLLVAGILLVSTELGFRLGRRATTPNKDEARTHIRALLASVFGLLALLLGFSFALSASRYEARRQLVVIEANSIGAAYLRSRLLPEPQRTEIDHLLRRYVDVRLESVAASTDQTRTTSLVNETGQIQNQLWSEASAVAAGGQAPFITSGFLQALNQVIDVRAEQVAAFQNHIPPPIALVLLVVAAVAFALTAYAGGLADIRNGVATTAAALLIALVVVLIVDLHRPTAGWITISQQPMIDLRATLESSGP